MAVHVIGDVQGCLEPLQRLLKKLNFNPKKDTVWFTGDIINRGPDSLATLRFIKQLGDSAVTVLGNHDIHLLHSWLNGVVRRGKLDTIDEILDADDADELVNWLLHRPILHYDKKLNAVMVHAGIPAQWTVKKAQRQARKLEAILQGPDARKLLKRSYRFTPRTWSQKLTKWERRCYALSAFTRMRHVYRNGKLEMAQKGPPGAGSDRLVPWFEAKNPRWKNQARIVFGHWATLGLNECNQTYCLDGGCVWGGQLIAATLKKNKVIKYTQIECSDD